MKNVWPIVPLGNCADPVERAEAPIPGSEYRQIGVKLWGVGAYERETIDGSQTKYKTLNRVKTGDIIVNKIWARNGSVAVVQDALDGTFGSGEFPTFRPRPNRLMSEWFHWFTKTRPCWEQCDEKSRGTSGKNRIRPERFLEVAIPLPPIEEQRRIVVRIEALAAKIGEATALSTQASESVNALLRSAMREVFGDAPRDDWGVLTDEVEDIENGWSPSCHPRRAENDEWGVLKVGAVSFGTFDARENKALPEALEPDPSLEIKPGDFLMSRANTVQLVGACALVHASPPRLMLCDKIFRFKFRDPAGANRRYWDWLMKSPPLRTQIERGASGTSPTMKNIAKAKIMALRIPKRPRGEQRRIVACLDTLSAKAESLKSLQQQSADELDVLLPSILDKAFRGEF